MSPRITILAFGTRGDVAPMTGLAAGLRGHLGATVAIAAQQPYEQMITDAGFDFRLLPRDTEADTHASPYGQAMVDGRKLKPSKEAIVGMREDLVGVGEAMAQAADDADLVLCGGPVGMLLGSHVAEALGRPSAALVFQPSYVTGDFAPPALGARSYGRLGNRSAWRLAGAGEKLFAPLIDDLRGTFGLPSESLRGHRRRLERERTQLCGFSTRVVPKPADWPDHVHVTGYWWPAVQGGPEAPAGLVRFLADGPPPVYIGLGSTAISDGAGISEIVREALRSSGQRGVIHRGWAHLDGGDDETLFTIGEVEHSWLLPQMAAAVHHCGAGTTAATLRAGIPSVALPGIMDQPFWAQRLHRLGCAPAPVSRTSVTASVLAELISSAVGDEQYRRSTLTVADELASEDGTTAACRIIETLLSAPTSSTHA
ncbi:glycosyltransferase [Gordonia sp. ABSL11-1]|uniref:glycosyltransferase n=1 Tax=Gordonia sp. ABSL11-1 TaxID=3053924 RepID=UPI0025731658|nr:glycosyltransferase [Gordonia sp. ABSL11-1]MDL9948925.1 glycosyltransferase [Gordonia sp. ABSL11-1]